MKCRKVNSDGQISWFTNNDYAEGSDAICASLTQRLSVLKGELWYQVNYGIPLTDKLNSVKLFDLVIADIITSHPEVTSIKSFKSGLTNHNYWYDAEIGTIYGEIINLKNLFE